VKIHPPVAATGGCVVFGISVDDVSIVVGSERVKFSDDSREIFAWGKALCVVFVVNQVRAEFRNDVTVIQLLVDYRNGAVGDNVGVAGCFSNGNDFAVVVFVWMVFHGIPPCD
jgi:hypothetical protein